MIGRVHGKCSTMCPEEEIDMRSRERMLHRLEMLSGSENEKYPTADPEKVVKCFGRSAADVNVAQPHLLRPFPVLFHTVKYLLFTVSENSNVSLASRYDYITDRVRSVRQDMTIQQLPPKQCVMLLEPMVRFHVLFGYKLCELSSKEYDSYLNQKHLLDTLKQLLVCYDLLEKDFGESINTFSNITLDKDNVVNSRSLIESLYIICNLQDVEPLRRYIQLPGRLRVNECVRTSFRLSLANAKNNYVLVCRLAKKLSVLPLCAFSLHLPTIQRNALETMSVAYSNQTLTFPTGVLREVLLFDTNDVVVETCKYYGLKADLHSVRFHKNDFNHKQPLMLPKKLLKMHKSFDKPFSEIFTYS